MFFKKKVATKEVETWGITIYVEYNEKTELFSGENLTEQQCLDYKKHIEEKLSNLTGIGNDPDKITIFNIGSITICIKNYLIEAFRIRIYSETKTVEVEDEQ